MAARSLSVQQEATAVAGQNLANVNNAAYARQSAGTSRRRTRLTLPAGQEGTGVVAVSITQVRSALLDNQIQSEEGVYRDRLTAQQSALEDAETYLNEQIASQTATTNGSDTSPNGLTAAISGLFNAFQSLSGNPDDPATRNRRWSRRRRAVTQQFNSISSGLGHGANPTSTLRSRAT